MKNFKKIVLPFAAATILGVAALSTPVGATALNTSSLPSNASYTVDAAAFPLTGLKKIATVVTKVAGAVTLVTSIAQLIGKTETGIVAAQLQASALD